MIIESDDIGDIPLCQPLSIGGQSSWDVEQRRFNADIGKVAAAGDPLLQRAVRRGARHRDRRRPMAGILGDQQAALFGQTCFDRGDAKNTYGTGCFLLVNTGEEIVRTEQLLTSVGYKLGDGTRDLRARGLDRGHRRAVQWLRDRLKIIDSRARGRGARAQRRRQRRRLLRAGLLRPVRALLARRRPRRDRRADRLREPRPHRPRRAGGRPPGRRREVVDAANAVADVPFTELRVDGGMTANELLMQFQADVLGVPVIRPKVTETTALGAAYAAGLAIGFWSDQDELRERWAEDKRWEPQMDDDERERGYARWKQAVARSLDWVD